MAAQQDPAGTVPDNSSPAGVVSSFFEHLARFNAPADTARTYAPLFGEMIRPTAQGPQGLTSLLFGISTFAGQADQRFALVSVAFAQVSVALAQKADKLKGFERGNTIASALTMASLAGMSQPRDAGGQPLELTRAMIDGLYQPLLNMSPEGGRPLIEACRTASGMTCLRTEHQQLNYYGHVANRAAKALGVMTSGLK